MENLGKDNLAFIPDQTPVMASTNHLEKSDSADTVILESDSAGTRYEIDGIQNDDWEKNLLEAYKSRELFYTKYKNLCLEEERFKTFKDCWFCQIKQSAQELAKNGFYYIGPGDRVKSICCDLVLSHWHPKHVISRRHKLHSPSCTGVLTTADDTENFARKISPNHSKMFCFRSRLETFKYWPGAMKQRAEDLATHGFYSCGLSDRVKCYSCGLVLHHWLPSEEIQKSHTVWSKGKCMFLY